MANRSSYDLFDPWVQFWLHIAVLEFTSSCYRTTSILKFGMSDKWDRTCQQYYEYYYYMYSCVVVYANR